MQLQCSVSLATLGIEQFFFIWSCLVENTFKFTIRADFDNFEIITECNGHNRLLHVKLHEFRRLHIDSANILHVFIYENHEHKLDDFYDIEVLLAGFKFSQWWLQRTYYLLGYDAMQSGRSLLIFGGTRSWSLLDPSFFLAVCLTLWQWRWKQYIHP
jgi:hypothetical protein